MLLIALGAVLGGVGTSFHDDFKLPDTESTRAYDTLGDGFKGADGDVDQIVFRATDGKVTDDAHAARATAMLAKVAKLPHVSSVTSPFDAAGGSQVSKSGKVAFATVNFDQAIPKLKVDNIERMVKTAHKARGEGLQVAAGGNGVEQVRQAKQQGHLGELIGILVAFIVMYVAFGSFLAALMPLVTALAALGIGNELIGLLSHVFSVATFGPTLAALIGLGVGVDYSLFIVTRHRANLLRGMTVEESLPIALATAGRAVLFAGVIVCIALLGMFLLGVSFLYGVAVSAAVVVACTVLSAVTLLPAVLSLLGMRVLSRRVRRKLAATSDDDKANVDVSPGWLRWGRIVERRPVIFAIVSAAVLIVLAVPMLDLRLGSSDAGNDPEGTSTRQAYDWLSEGFGAGFNGPFQLVAKIDGAGDKADFQKVVDAVGNDRGVALATPAVISPSGKVALAQVYPTTSPQSKATSDLLGRMRDHIVPGASKGSGLTVDVGGITAIFEDFSTVLADKLPLFIGIVVLLSFVLLSMVFRSLLIPLVAAVMNLLAIGASFGVVVAVFQWGWLGSVTGIDHGGPIEAFVPVMMFAILFGLSMDYEVFLVSRMHEEWVARRDNTEAVTIGQAETGRVITAAGLIMIVVFGSFVFGGERVIELFGVALAAAVLFDAMIIRTMLVPALMHLLGRANWWLPGWLDRALPNLSIEGAEHPAPTPVADEA